MRCLTRVTFDPNVMGGKPCIRGLRVTVGMLVGLVASGHSAADILRAYPYLENEDISEALAYAAWRVEEVELPLAFGLCMRQLWKSFCFSPSSFLGRF